MATTKRARRFVGAIAIGVGLLLSGGVTLAHSEDHSHFNGEEELEINYDALCEYCGCCDFLGCPVYHLGVCPDCGGIQTCAYHPENDCTSW
jgi:hypothetical protein